MGYPTITSLHLLSLFWILCEIGRSCVILSAYAFLTFSRLFAFVTSVL